MSRSIPIALLALCAAFAPEAQADRVLTVDGRILTPKKAREKDGGYRFVFENGEILVPDKSHVQSVEIEGDMSEYVPQNDDERQKLQQGFVKYRGKWLSGPSYQEELRKLHEASRKRTEELAAHSDWENAWKKETAHFLVRSNTSPELLDYYCELLEAYYSLMDDRIGIDPPPTLKRTKMTVNIYKSSEEFHSLSPSQAGISASVLGYFWAYDKTLNFYHDYQEPALSTWVALHECTHLLTYLIDPQYVPQIWLNEAIADYFGSSKVSRDKKGKIVIQPGELQMDRVLTVQQAIKNTLASTGESKKPSSASKAASRPVTKLEDLFMLNRDAFDGFQYAHAWSFVYFLNSFENGKYRKNFDKFFKGLYTLEKGLEVEVVAGGGNTGTGKQVTPKAIREYLLKKLNIKDVPQLEKDWIEFVRQIPILAPEARLKRGLQSVRRGEFADAIGDLDAAIEGGVTDPRAWWARGRARAMSGKIKDAEADVRKAIELSPLNATFRYDLSNLLVGRVANAPRGKAPPSAAEGDEAKIQGNDEAKREAGLASELDPENDRFREWFARFE